MPLLRRLCFWYPCEGNPVAAIEEGMGKVDVDGSDSRHHENESRKRRKKAKKLEKEDGCPNGFHSPTVSIAVSGSIIDNAQSLELATRLAGQIARAATIFRINEVVVFDAKSSGRSCVTTTQDGDQDYEGGASFLVRILQYLETPQYLRRALFPKHSSLRFVGLLPPLDAPHHVRKHEWSPYREGVTLKGKPSNSCGTMVDVGLNKEVVVAQELEPGLRVTVAMGSNRLESNCLLEAANPSNPSKELGLYWGYKVRYASNIGSVFTECPFKDGYDYKIGTSEHGDVLNSSEFAIPTFRHLLIAFGGLGGLEENIEEDPNLKGKDVREVFDSYLNTCAGQGSRTIRTEEAVLICLQYFQEPIKRATL